jgi:hypothetical protein
MNKIFLFFWLLTTVYSTAQELNCTVTVNTEKLQNANQQVFKTLKTSLTEFINKTQWSGKVFKQNEKINCSMNLILSSYDSDKYTATLQVQSSRIVYNSSYSTPILNFNDKDFSFNYTEYQILVYNPAEFESNLVSVVSFYCQMILGLDADSFTSMGGTSFFETAQNVATVAQQSGYKGWNLSDGVNSKYFLVTDLLSAVYKDIRESSALYHSGLDSMADKLKEGKEKVKTALVNIGELSLRKPNAFVTRVFFDAKSDEIVSIFSGGPSIAIDDLTVSLTRSSPLNSSKWANIKF